MNKPLFTVLGSAVALLSPYLTHTTNAGDDMNARVEVLSRENDKLERFTLSNGLECLLKPDRSAPVVSIQFRVSCGSMHEEQHLGSGISHSVEHMLFKGTPTRAPGVVTREINDAGGRVNAYTTFDRTVYYADMPAAQWQTGFDVLADALMHASFPEDEWKLEREVILREVAMGEDNPDRMLGHRLWQTAFRSDTRRHPVIGYTDTFKTLTRNDLVTYFGRHYTPDHTILVIVGDIDSLAVRAHITETLDAFKRRPSAPVILPVEPPQLSPRFERVTGDYNIGRLAATWPSVAIHHPDAAALDILAHIAGQGRSSRLNRSLVEDRKLLHSISVWSFTPGRVSGLFGLSAEFDPENEETVISAIRQEVEYLKTVPFTKQEVDMAVRSALTAQIGELESMSGQAAQYGSNLENTGDPRFSETYLRQISAVTPDDLTRVARQHLTTAGQSLVLLVPDSADSGVTGESDITAAPAVVKAQTMKLDSGVPLMVREDSRLPFVYIAVALQGGVRSEPASKSGITALMADLLLRGTATRSREEIALAVESIGASLSPYSDYNAYGLTARCLSSDAETVLSLLADCLLNPLFEENEIARQRDLQLAGIRQQAEQPMFLAQQQLRSMLFSQHPYRNTPAGTAETVSALTRDDLMSHHRSLTVAGNLAVSIFGDISAAGALKLANTALAAIPGGAAASITTEVSPSALPSRALKEVPREQAIVLVGFPGITIADPQQEALNVLQTAMSGLSSELALEIRDKRGLAYYTGAMQQVGIDPGMFVIYAGTHREAAEQVEALFQEEIRRLTVDGLHDDEIARAKAQLVAGHAMSLQDPLSVAQECALNVCYGLGADYLFGRPERIAAVTASDILAAARRILDPQREAVSVILPMPGNISNN